MIDVEKTGKKVHALMKDRYKTNTEIGKALGITHAAVAKWGRGEGMPSIDNLVLIADMTGNKVDDLVVRSKL